MYWYIKIVGILISFKITLLATVYRNNWSASIFNCFFAIQSVLCVGMKSPIMKLLASINQSNSANLVYMYYKFFNRAKEENIYAITSTFADIEFFVFF